MMTNAASDRGTPILLEKLNANDNRYLIVDWLVGDGETVEPGTLLLSVETSKAIEEIVTPIGGTLRHNVEVGKEYDAGTVLAFVAASPGAEPSR